MSTMPIDQACQIEPSQEWGGRYSETRSAAEPVCLPPDPDFVKTSGSGNDRIYGAEFYNNEFASNSRFQDVQCAVCRVKQASSVIMIPGKNRCYTGWKIEYHGYLASNEYDHPAAGSFVCVHIQPEYVNGGSSWGSFSKLIMMLWLNVDHFVVHRTNRIIPLHVLFVQNKIKVKFNNK
ncbi:unnamed protein product [Mytilus coruscus]|uniref:Uncharacterized protein n=1 Tax=Mytilus coruscus TaxID=42192 RepID=A0A6J8EK73_MYTCO|nr:unnamed protein product [Mytilus coruscus]